MKAPETLSERGRAVRSALLAAALEVFAERGFTGATVGEICERAGVNRAMIGYHFDNKAGLYAVVIGELVDEARGEIEASTSMSEREGRDPIDVWIDALANLYHRRPALARLIVRGMLDGDFASLRSASEALKGFFLLTQTMLERALVRYPRLKGFDPHILHLICAGALVHFSLTMPFRVSASGRLGVSQPTQKAFAQALAQLLREA